MNHPDYLKPIIEKIQPYNPFDLLAKVGALQLCPENANYSIRIEALAHAINCLKYDSNKPSISRHKLDEICNEPPLGKGFFQSQEDPTPNGFTEAFTFYGGPYIVFPGQIKDATFVLKTILSAIFLGDEFKGYEKFKDKTYRIIQGVVSLSDIIAKRTGLRRNMLTTSHLGRIFIPQDIMKIENYVVFTRQELKNLPGSTGSDSLSLDPFIQEFGSIDSTSYSFENSPIHSRPIIKCNDNYIVSEPWMLLASLRNIILITAKEFGLIELLSKQYHKFITFNIGKSLNRFNFEQIPFPLPRNELVDNFSESLWNLDTDKILYVGVISDDFNNYVGMDVFEVNSNDDGEFLDGHLANIEKLLFKKTANLSEVFYIIIVAGIGRIRVISSRFDNMNRDSTILLLSASDLEVLSVLYGFDKLLLFKFAKAYNAIRKRTTIIGTSLLDEFALYKKNDYSYYITDDKCPNVITIFPGEEREITDEFLGKFDAHAVPSYNQDGWIEVVNIHQSPSCPIYAPNLVNTKQISFFIELSPLSFWVLTKKTDVQSETRKIDIPNPGLFVDMVSYWIWQAENYLSLFLNKPQIDTPFIIEIKVDESLDWSRDSIQLKREDDFLSLQIESNNHVNVIFRPSVVTLLHSPENSGEVKIMQQIFGKLCELFSNNGWVSSGKDNPDAILGYFDLQLKTPQKKKIISIDINQTPFLLPGNPIGFRKIQEADRSVILDEIGNYLINDLHMDFGIIPVENHTKVLNSIVWFLFKILSEKINSLSPDHLLEFLVAHYEAITSERFYRQISIPTEMACFSTVQELAQQLMKQLPDIDEAALSCRFLIEFIATQPPSGNVPISLSVYDNLMAIAAEIINFGSQSDQAKYKLYDFTFKILNSGRLGFNKSGFETRLKGFQNLRSREEIEKSWKGFDGWWKERENIEAINYPPIVKMFDKAFESEFGILLSDVSRFVSELGSISIESDNSQLKIIEYEELINKIISITGWDKEKIEEIIKFLALFPRKDYLNPPEPFRKADIYPWRMSRSLSYMRRPLLIQNISDKVFVCWGVRHLFASFDYILNTATAGRLQVDIHSKEMREFLGIIHAKEGEEFNINVYSQISKANDVLMYKRVNKFQKTRIGAPGNDLGDIDVVAIFSKKKTILIIECKDLEIARNPIEMSRELEFLFVGSDKKESTVTKHLKRLEWIKANIELVLTSFGLKNNTKWKVIPIIIVSREMMSPHFHQPEISVYSLSRFLSVFLPKLQ